MSLFITFEGGEGSGKSTQVQRLYHRLCRAGFAVVLVREPGGTPLGERLGRLLKHSRRSEVAIAPVAELFLFNACRAQLVSDVILPALDRGEIVLCDRYSDSTLAYQGYGRGLDLGTVRTVNRLATGRAIPDLTVLLDIPVEEG
ncbi:MAG: dTMP kinase, partial [Dehalococcoidales bacterium]|nr:dTMP kinase [Dehalococcoidales bacterium]